MCGRVTCVYESCGSARRYTYIYTRAARRIVSAQPPSRSTNSRPNLIITSRVQRDGARHCARERERATSRRPQSVFFVLPSFVAPHRPQGIVRPSARQVAIPSHSSRPVPQWQYARLLPPRLNNAIDLGPRMQVGRSCCWSH